MEFSAISWFFELRTIGTRGVLVFHAARPDLAPGRLLVVVATGAPILQVGRASTAVEAAVSDQIWIDGDFFHNYLSSAAQRIGLVFWRVAEFARIQDRPPF